MAWFDEQEEYCFYGCSVLITYEGTATTPEELNVSAKLIDFAHSFGGQGKKVPGPVIVSSILSAYDKCD